MFKQTYFAVGLVNTFITVKGLSFTHESSAVFFISSVAGISDLQSFERESVTVFSFSDCTDASSLSVLAFLAP